MVQGKVAVVTYSQALLRLFIHILSYVPCYRSQLIHLEACVLPAWMIRSFNVWAWQLVDGSRDVYCRPRLISLPPAVPGPSQHCPSCDSAISRQARLAPALRLLPNPYCPDELLVVRSVAGSLDIRQAVLPAPHQLRHGCAVSRLSGFVMVLGAPC
jgi:hypothetical protein